MKILVLDIETSPAAAYVWGLWNQNISIGQIIEDPRMLSWAAKFHGDKRIHYADEFIDGRRGMLEQLHDLLMEADAVAGWNSDTFDIPWINGEFDLVGLHPVPPLIQIDLMKVHKKRRRFISNKLDYVAGRLIARKKVKHEGFNLWKRCLAGDAKAWYKMGVYNRGDVVITDKLLTGMMPHIKSINLNLTNGTTDRCPYCGSDRLQRRGYRYTRVSRYQRFQCQKCHGWSSDGKRDHGAETRPA
ncbi:MAG: ribonuclease H-like domain-containing protein [Mycobacteriaceae bacterium]